MPVKKEKEGNETIVNNNDESVDQKEDKDENINENENKVNDNADIVNDNPEKTNDKQVENEKTNNTTNDEKTVEGFDMSTEKDETVTCIFLINVKYNKDIKKIGDSIELDIEEAEFLEGEEVLQIVRK